MNKKITVTGKGRPYTIGEIILAIIIIIIFILSIKATFTSHPATEEDYESGPQIPTSHGDYFQ